MKTRLTQLILILAIITISQESNANKIYDGYVKTLLGKMHTGQIKMQTPSLNEVKVHFKSKAGKKHIFKADEVKEYGFEVEKWNSKERKHYTTEVIYVKKKVERSPVAFGPKEVLLEREVKGAICLYHHFIEKNANVEEPLEHILYVEKINNELMPITKKNYRAILKKITREYEGLQEEIGEKGKSFNNLAQIIMSYNEWIMDNGEEEVMDL
jgi:hypothetical protein